MNTLSDRDVLAATIYGEARGESVEGRIAVACTIRNRVQMDLRHDGRPDWWGEGYTGVCCASSQFSCWNANDPNRPVLDALAQQLAAGVLVTDQVFLECQWIADGVIAGRVVNPIGHSTHYITTSIAPPVWTRHATLVAQIGHHLFYGNVP